MKYIVLALTFIGTFFVVAGVIGIAILEAAGATVSLLFPIVIAIGIILLIIVLILFIANSCNRCCHN